MAAVKVGNFVRPSRCCAARNHHPDGAGLRDLLRAARLPAGSAPGLTNETATIEATIPGDQRRAGGQVTMIENSVDAPTGTVPVRATMPNTDELLWPGTLVTARLTFREEEAVAVPSTAVQVSQTGTYVFVVKDGAANVQPVTVARVIGSESVIANGLEGGETVVTNGQLLLSNGTKVAPRAGRKQGPEP